MNELKQTRRENKVLDQRLVTINGQCDGGRAGALATAVEQVRSRYCIPAVAFHACLEFAL